MSATTTSATTSSSSAAASSSSSSSSSSSASSAAAASSSSSSSSVDSVSAHLRPFASDSLFNSSELPSSFPSSFPLPSHPPRDILLITSSSLDFSSHSATSLINHCSAGGYAFFYGVTRDHADGQKVLALEYEAYLPMCYTVLQEICREIRDIHSSQIFHLLFVHRIGRVAVGESSVIIGASAIHRRNALEAVDYAIHELKKRVPIWKKEIYSLEKCPDNCEMCRLTKESAEQHAQYCAPNEQVEKIKEMWKQNKEYQPQELTQHTHTNSHSQHHSHSHHTHQLHHVASETGSLPPWSAAARAASAAAVAVQPEPEFERKK